MAQAKSRSASGARASGSKRAHSPAVAARPSSKAAKSATSPTARKPARTVGKRSHASAAGSARATSGRQRQGSNGHGGVEAPRNAVIAATSDAGNSIWGAAKSVKGPLLAGSAALAGLAGGVALGAARGPARLVGARPRKGGFQIRSQDVATTAKEIGSFAEHLGMVAAEIRRTREAAASSKHRSPIEVVLQGLTARR
jgi:hypothetical protein